MKSIVLLINLMFLGMVSSQVHAQSNEASASVDSLITIETKVKGVGCFTDIKTISANVESVEGVQSCEAEKPGAVTTFVILYNPTVAKLEDIYGAVENTGGCENPNDKPYKVKR